MGRTVIFDKSTLHRPVAPPLGLPCSRFGEAAQLWGYRVDSTHKIAQGTFTLKSAFAVLTLAFIAVLSAKSSHSWLCHRSPSETFRSARGRVCLNFSDVIEKGAYHVPKNRIILFICGTQEEEI